MPPVWQDIFIWNVLGDAEMSQHVQVQSSMLWHSTRWMKFEMAG